MFIRVYDEIKFACSALNVTWQTDVEASWIACQDSGLSIKA